MIRTILRGIIHLTILSGSTLRAVRRSVSGKRVKGIRSPKKNCLRSTPMRYYDNVRFFSLSAMKVELNGVQWNIVVCKMDFRRDRLRVVLLTELRAKTNNSFQYSIPYVKTCEILLCFVAIVRVGVYYVEFFVFFVLRQW